MSSGDEHPLPTAPGVGMARQLRPSTSNAEDVHVELQGISATGINMGANEAGDAAVNKNFPTNGEGDPRHSSGDESELVSEPPPRASVMRKSGRASITMPRDSKAQQEAMDEAMKSMR